MNHGYCSKCFWYKYGHCFMLGQSANDNGYCFDYFGRSRSKSTIDDLISEWIKLGKFSEERLQEIKDDYDKRRRNN